MPRQPRLDLANVPQHVIQRGNDRQPCFFTEADYLRYLSDLREISLREGCSVHAYVLMTNHVHLLMTPSSIGWVARVMQALGRRHVRYVNDRYRRTGTLWEGRYKACLVDSEIHLLRCYRYIELNPVRARMVADASDYPWSSYASNAFGSANRLIRPHASYLSLGTHPHERCEAYRALVMQTIAPEELDGIRQHLQRQHALGSDRFRMKIEALLERRAGPAKIGRPRKSDQP
ncbi:putative transposase [Dyella sp. OK004]|uniref:transposase n=1 Tax=Dyella sp. OK004 TaxID=1855292 RepID=UPI0008F1FBED|nr:transposase [Dyella sp. OK004]SFS06396.1 putative transposase [Dyella sp. OK004]